MANAKSQPGHDELGASTTPFCVLTSSSLADHQAWRNESRGEYSVVRLNFLADIGQVRAPVAYTDHPVDAQHPQRKHQPAPLGTVNLSSTLRPLIPNDLTDDLHTAVQRYRKKFTFEQRHELRDHAKSAVVQHRIRQDNSGAQSNQVPVTRSPGHRVPVRSHKGQPAFLVGERDVTLYLAYIDFMFVSFRRKYLGLNQTRSKSPAYNDYQTSRLNELNMGGFPFVSLRVPEFVAVSEPSSKLSYTDATSLNTAQIGDVPEPKTYAKENLRDQVATLYRISNAAFPLPRERARAGTWTEADLMALPDGPDKAAERRRFRNKP